MSADSPRNTRKRREVTPLKRLTIFAVVALVALIVVPAAFAGYRPLALDGFTPVTTCEACHGASAPPISDWAQTAHASVANNTEQSNRATCAGCHSGNFDPAQPIAWDLATGVGDNPTEAFVGCSACHYNAVTTHKGVASWNPPPATSNPLDYGQFANPDVCGQCHDQRSQAMATYPVYNPADPGTPTPTTLRFWPGYDPFTTPLASVINVGSQLQRWPNTPYTLNVHDTGAVQYDEMAQGWYSGALPVPEGTPLPITHFNSWAVLNTFVPDTAVSANEKVNFCGHCMSADQRILVAGGLSGPKLIVNPDPNQPAHDSNNNVVTKDEIKYGDSCVACHDPHKRGVSNSVWGGEHEGDASERNAQLIERNPGTNEVLTRATLCGSCHNGELAEGETTFAPGAEINHPTKEFMDGIGAIDVPKMPALHTGFCVQCHMVPTAITGSGDASVAANHVFTPIMPEQAMDTTTAINISGSAEIVEVEEETAGTTVTITTRTPLNWTAAAVGLNVTIAGVPVAGYNGTFAVTAIVSASSFTYTNPASGLAASNGGTVTFSSMPTTRHMPYSACSTCHEGTNGDNPAKTEAMQQIIDQRQEWTDDDGR